MDQGPLLIEQIDAGVDFLGYFDRLFPVKVAFWLNESETERWYLYVASEAINSSTSGRGYGEVFRLAQEMPHLNVDPYRVRVVGADNPVARAAIDIQSHYPANLPTRYRGPQMGGVGIEEAYIYPQPAMVPGA